MNPKTPLDYYQQALMEFRLQCDSFVKSYPNVANHLNMGTKRHEDPHVTRLIESLAFMQSQTQAQLEHNAQALNQQLVQSWFPEHTAPIPSMSVVQFTLNKGLQTPIKLAKGTQFETALIKNEPCYFQAGYDTELLPLTVQQLHTKRKKNCVQLSITLENTESIAMQTLQPNCIRLFLGLEGQMINHVLTGLHHPDTVVSLINIEGKGQKLQQKPVGFGLSQRLLPQLSPHTVPYSNLLEYTYYREKFHFIDIEMTPTTWDNWMGSTLTLQWQLPLEFAIYITELKASHIHLNCVPIINLFERHLEPVEIDHTQAYTPLVVDRRNQDHFQIHHLTDVIRADTETILQPSHRASEDLTEPSWQLVRPQIAIAEHSRLNDCYLALSDSDFYLSLNSLPLSIKAWCSNGSLPMQCQWPLDEVYLQTMDTALPIAQVSCLKQPTAYHTHPLTNERLKLAVTLLSQQRTGLLNPDEALVSLQRLFNLCEPKQSEHAKSLNQYLSNVSIQADKRYLNDHVGNPIQAGFLINIQLHENAGLQHSVWLLHAVLEACYQYHAPLNHYIDLNLKFESIIS